MKKLITIAMIVLITFLRIENGEDDFKYLI